MKLIKLEQKINSMKTIIFPTDFSKATEQAKSFAIDFALKNDALLLILNIYQMPQVRSGSFSSSLLGVIKKDSLAKMEELETEISQKYPNLKTRYNCILGDPISVINDIAESEHADLIIMGTHGASGLEEILMGSNTQAVIKKATTSVLAIPNNTDLSKLQNFALASDLNFNKTKQAIAIVKTLCKSFETGLKIIHFADFLDETEEQEENLHTIFNDIEHEYIERMTSNLDTGLAEFVQFEKINLLMMIHRKHGFWESLFTTSNSEKRALHTKIPLLILKEDNK